MSHPLFYFLAWSCSLVPPFYFVLFYCWTSVAVCADVPGACFCPWVPCRGTCAYILLLLVAVFERNYYDLYVAYSNCSVLHVALPVPT